MTSKVPAAISELIFRFYGRSSSPDFTLVGEVERRRPYDALLARLRTRYRVEDQTDLNEDVSFAWAIIGPSEVLLRLSFVGPFAVLVTDAANGWSVLEPDDVPDEGFLRDLDDEVRREGFTLMGREIVSVRLEIWPDDDNGLVELQHALFVAGEDLPM